MNGGDVVEFNGRLKSFKKGLPLVRDFGIGDELKAGTGVGGEYPDVIDPAHTAQQRRLVVLGLARHRRGLRERGKDGVDEGAVGGRVMDVGQELIDGEVPDRHGVKQCLDTTFDRSNDVLRVGMLLRTVVAEGTLRVARVLTVGLRTMPPVQDSESFNRSLMERNQGDVRSLSVKAVGGDERVELENKFGMTKVVLLLEVGL